MLTSVHYDSLTHAQWTLYVFIFMENFVHARETGEQLAAVSEAVRGER